ncbi:MAG: hypothetical protein A3G66_03610 [Candidatus Levybacteria bacterium RIFCSPLOWO2_12_FULL_39_17]|nr:MAG: hypothetical protein A3G66_03610 [Candidatus Levybacteria bacterium RIFCSPLOWO2_12_FULL_39_17]
MESLFNIKKSSVLSFVLGFSGVAIMIILNSIGLKPVKTIDAIIQRETKVQKVQDRITPKLEKIKNNFKIKKNKNIVPRVYGDNTQVEAKAYGAIDFNTGEVLVHKNLEMSLPIASVTKIMTAVVALDLAEKDDLFTVSRKASKVSPTKIGVVPEQKMTLQELLNALLLTSANDAAEVIKEGINVKYQGEVFVASMNKKAKFLNLKNSNFANPQGFDNKKNYSSVGDLAVLTHYALSNYPIISEIVKKDYEFLPKNQNHKQFDLYNWNGLIGVYPNTIGVKIGNTGLAGKTTVVVSQREGNKIISIVLGAPGILERDLWAAKLLDLGFEQKGLKAAMIKEDDLNQKYNSWKYWN